MGCKDKMQPGQIENSRLAAPARERNLLYWLAPLCLVAGGWVIHAFGHKVVSLVLFGAACASYLFLAPLSFWESAILNAPRTQQLRFLRATIAIAFVTGMICAILGVYLLRWSKQG